MRPRRGYCSINPTIVALSHPSTLVSKANLAASLRKRGDLNAAVPLMEDVAISKALKGISRPACLADRVTTSGRRWESRGVLATVALMWRLRFAYALGAVASFAVLGLAIPGGAAIEEPEAASVSYPGFWKELLGR